MIMDRREALSTVTFLLGGTIIGAEAFLSGCSNQNTSQENLFSEDVLSLLNAIGETILPATPSSPGAEEANVAVFMKSIVMDCYSVTEQTIFFEGLKKIKQNGKQYGNDFLKLTRESKYACLMALEKEAAGYQETKKPDDPEIHYYTMVKQLTVWGFLSSEAGATKAMRHVAVPGRYEGCIPLKQGEKAWA